MANDCHYKIDSLCFQNDSYPHGLWTIQWWMNVEMTNPYTDKRSGKIS